VDCPPPPPQIAHPHGGQTFTVHLACDQKQDDRIITLHNSVLYEPGRRLFAGGREGGGGARLESEVDGKNVGGDTGIGSEGGQLW